MNKFKAFLNSKRDAQQRESGNTLVLFIMLFPVIFSVFGLAIDVAIGNFVSNSVQNSINTSTQITLSQASNPINSDRPMLSNQEASEIVKRLYAQNTGREYGPDGNSTANLPFLLCQENAIEGGNLTTSPSVSACAWTEPANGFKFSNDNRMMTIEYSTVEISRTAFLQFLGISHLTYRVSGKATTSFSGNLS